jgi:hypothetical protein
MFVVVLALTVLGDPHLSDPPGTVPAEAFARATLPHKIVLMDAQKWVPADDPRVARARYVLRVVDTLYVEDEPEIGKLLESAWRGLRAKQKTTLASDILEAATHWQKTRSEKAPFKDFVTLYAKLREGGATHDQALNFLR